MWTPPKPIVAPRIRPPLEASLRAPQAGKECPREMQASPPVPQSPILRSRRNAAGRALALRGPRRPLRLLAGLWEAGAQVRSRERVAAGSAEPAPHRRPRGSIRGADGTDLPPWTETRHREEVLIKTPKRVCLIERIRDKILKGQHALPGERVFRRCFITRLNQSRAAPREAREEAEVPTTSSSSQHRPTRRVPRPRVSLTLARPSRPPHPGDGGSERSARGHAASEPRGWSLSQGHGITKHSLSFLTLFKFNPPPPPR